jgi:hypothetical protein
MRNAFLRLCLLTAAAILAFAPCASADSTATVYFNGSYSFANNGFGIPPYGGTLNGIAAQFDCVDFSHDISAGMSWTAFVTPLTATADYSNTYLKNETKYMEMAWLITQMMGTKDQTIRAEDQWAIWTFTGATDPYGLFGPGGAMTLRSEALAAVNSGWTAQDMQILTPIPGAYGQEFVSPTPEPASLFLLGSGFVGFLVKRRKQSIAA